MALLQQPRMENDFLGKEKTSKKLTIYNYRQMKKTQVLLCLFMFSKPGSRGILRPPLGFASQRLPLPASNREVERAPAPPHPLGPSEGGARVSGGLRGGPRSPALAWPRGSDLGGFLALPLLSDELHTRPCGHSH